MMKERLFLCGRLGKVLVLAITILLCSSYLAFGQTAGTVRHKVFTHKNISAQQGKKYLAQAGIGTASQLPGTNTLLITGQPTELNKAIALLGLVDAQEKFAVRKFAPSSIYNNQPSNKQIAGLVGNISIGSFSNPPTEKAPSKAIIDIHNGVVLAIAPVSQIEGIASAIAKLNGTASQNAALVPKTFDQARSRSSGREKDRNIENSSSGAASVSRPLGTTEGVLGKMEGQKSLPLLPSPAPATHDEKWGSRAGGGGQESDSLNSVTRSRDKVERMAFQPQSYPKVAPNMIGKPDLSDSAQQFPVGYEDRITGKERINNKDRISGTSSLEPIQSDFTRLEGFERTKSSYRSSMAQSYEPPPIPNGEDVLSETLPEKLDITYLLSLAGTYLNLDFVYNPEEVKGDVTLLIQGKLRGPIKVKDLYPLLESVLRFKGFVMTRHKGNLVTVVREEDALKIDPELMEVDGGEVEHGDMIVTRIFELQYIGTDSAENLLKNMQLGVKVTPLTEVNKLIVTGFAYRMPRIEKLIYMVDRPGEPRRFRFRQLQFTMAQALAPKVQALAEQLDTVSITVAEQPEVSVPTIRRLANESTANYQRRVAAAKQAALKRAQAARPVKPDQPAQQTVYLDADERTNRILMIGLREQLDIVEELIDTLDVEQQDLRTLAVYKINHVDAEEVRNKLAELGIIAAPTEVSSPYSRITAPTKTPTKPMLVRTQADIDAMNGEAGESLLEQPQVVVIESTNALLVNATDEQHFRISSIIAFVDSEMEEKEIPYQLYPLENSSPQHLAEILQNLIEETIQENKEDKTVERVVKRREEDITIVPDPNTFSLIVYASKKHQEWIAGLIEKLDKRRPQVLIDVTLVEVSKSDAFNVDLNLIESFSDLTETSGLVSGLIPGTGPVNLVEALTNRTTGSRPDRFIDLQSNKGSGLGFYGDSHINALLTAMQEKNYGRILAKPKILVNDNMPGTISTTDTTYVTRTSSIPVSSGAAGQQTTLIQTAEEFEGFDAGIELGITPHISKGDLLRLDINLTRSDFGTITGDKPPDTTTSAINTTVTVPDGSTIILGGLLKLNQSKGGKKVPLLGDIPLVGGLFRGVSNSDIQKKLYVFVKAEVIRPEDTTYAMGELVRISDRNREAFERHEREFQEYQDWPGIKPKPIDPLKVLEAE